MRIDIDQLDTSARMGLPYRQRPLRGRFFLHNLSFFREGTFDYPVGYKMSHPLGFVRGKLFLKSPPLWGTSTGSTQIKVEFFCERLCSESGSGKIWNVKCEVCLDSSVGRAFPW